MDHIINPVLLYLACALGGVGVAIALPRKTPVPTLLGALLAAAGGGLAILALTLKAGEHLPNVYFYIFSLVALGGAVRVITHPKPVYSALYFILTLIATAGLFLILSAEFMAFALIIVYAGAILITYLFVIMLATQQPAEDQTEVAADCDVDSREPVLATFAGFIVLAALSTLGFSGISKIDGIRNLAGVSPTSQSNGLVATMPRKVQQAFLDAGLLTEGRTIAQNVDGTLRIDAQARTATLVGGPKGEEVVRWPADLQATNVESVGFNLLRDHPGSIEIAGVLLLMAMLGAVVLARKQVQIDEDIKTRNAMAKVIDLPASEPPAQGANA